ncbi:MAG: hypothetical protein OCD02_12470 [Spirochaetaceae bacterium]
MNSRERVVAVLNHEIPDRVPMWCGASPELIEKARKYLKVEDVEAVYRRFGDDFRRVLPKYIGPPERSWTEELSEGATMRTPFNIERNGIGYGQPLSHPLKNATLEDIENYPWPKAEWYTGKDIQTEVKKWNGEYAILGGDWSPFWHDAMDLFGMEELFIKMYTEPEIVTAVFDHIVEYYFQVNKIVFEDAGNSIDIFFLGNDFGGQNGPLVGLELFDKYVTPGLKKLSALAHSYRLKVMMHCCGGYEPLMSSIIESGIDALQSLQPDALGMDPQDLKKTYGDKVILNGGIDSHNILIDGTPELTIQATKKAMAILKPKGNYILSASHDYLLEETPVENILAMFDTAKEIGVY